MRSDGGSFILRYNTSDPEERLAQAIVKTVARDYVDNYYKAYCYERIIRDFEQSDAWQERVVRQQEYDLLIGRKQKIEADMRRNALACFRMGGRVDGTFPYAPNDTKLLESTMAQHTRQISVNAGYRTNWRRNIDRLEVVKKEIDAKDLELCTGNLKKTKLEHDALIRNMNQYESEKVRNARWFSTDWAKVLMMNAVQPGVIVLQLKKRAKMYVKRVKAARVKLGMHPYDYRYDTVKQKNALTVELRSLLGEDEE